MSSCIVEFIERVGENVVPNNYPEIRHLTTMKDSYNLLHLNISRNMTIPTLWPVRQAKTRSAWASAQSDQSLRCVLNGKIRTHGSLMWTAKSLIRVGGCLG